MAPIPSSRSVRKIRTAISPRLATRTFENRAIPCLFSSPGTGAWALEVLVVAEVLDDAGAPPHAPVSRRNIGRREQAFESNRESFPLFRIRFGRNEEIHWKETKGLRPR